MMPFVGYPGLCWSVVYASFLYFINTLQNASNPGTTVPLASAVFYTCSNALEAMNIYRIVQAWTSEYQLLTQVEAAPIFPTPSQATPVQNRIFALGEALNSLSQIIPTISTNNIQNTLNMGNPTIPDAGYLNWLNNFAFETPPAGLSSSNFINDSQAIVNAFEAIAQLVYNLEAPQPDSLYDVCIRFANTAQVVTNGLNGITSGPIQFPNGATQTWNQLASSPALLLDAFLVSTQPYDIQSQQDMVLRFIILTIANQLAQFLLVMRQPLTATINQATLLVGNTLMDVAASNTGNFENWASIAQANGLLPPYVGPQTIVASGIAGWGSQLILPNAGTSGSAVGVVPSYALNYLGVDEYIGPINGSMPNWTGDYQTVYGYKNLAWALGRRLQTTLGSLIYHSDYGCRIPPEVGNVQDNSTVGHIAAFGEAALQQDPRVAKVIYAIAQSLPEFAIAFQGAVQPGGFGSTPVQINEVIQPTTAQQ